MKKVYNFKHSLKDCQTVGCGDWFRTRQRLNAKIKATQCKPYNLSKWDLKLLKRVELWKQQTLN